MSPFKPRRLRLSLEPDRVALLRTGGRRCHDIDGECQLEVGLDPSRPEAGLAGLEQLLAGETRQVAAAEVVLSDRLVRYFVLEPIPGLKGLAELKQLADSRFEEILEQPAADWEIALDLSPFASRFLACAVPRRLLAGLRAVFAGRGPLPLSIQPFLVREFNRWRQRLGGGPAWFAAAERGSLTLALISRQGWLGLRTHRLQGPLREVLPTLLDRDRLAYGLPQEPPRLWLVGGAAAQGLDGQEEPLPVTVLDQGTWPGRSPEWSRDYRLALAGAWQ